MLCDDDDNNDDDVDGAFSNDDDNDDDFVEDCNNEIMDVAVADEDGGVALLLCAADVAEEGVCVGDENGEDKVENDDEDNDVEDVDDEDDDKENDDDWGRCLTVIVMSCVTTNTSSPESAVICVFVLLMTH